MCIRDDLTCLDPKDGTTRWQWTDKVVKGSNGIPAIVGDYMVLPRARGMGEARLVAYSS